MERVVESDQNDDQKRTSVSGGFFYVLAKDTNAHQLEAGGKAVQLPASGRCVMRSIGSAACDFDKATNQIGERLDVPVRAGLLTPETPDHN